ncbi:unnamed protein product [Tilletia caries]|nr:unnamed protein product [Tilletia caries]
MPPRPTRSNTNLPENIADIIDQNIGTNTTPTSASEPTLLDLLRQMQTSETSMKQSFADLNTRFAQNDDRYTAVIDRLTALESALPGSSSSAPSNTMSAQASTSNGAPPTGQNPTTARATEGWNSFHTA